MRHVQLLETLHIIFLRKQQIVWSSEVTFDVHIMLSKKEVKFSRTPVPFLYRPDSDIYTLSCQFHKKPVNSIHVLYQTRPRWSRLIRWLSIKFVSRSFYLLSSDKQQRVINYSWHIDICILQWLLNCALIRTTFFYGYKIKVGLAGGCCGWTKV